MKELPTLEERKKVKTNDICVMVIKNETVLLETTMWVKLLIAISRMYQLVRSWELRTWSLKFNSIDILTASPHYFCKKCIETQKENL